MKMPLPEADKLPLKPGELAELASKARQARELMQEAHDAYERKADRIRAEVASRYDGEAFRQISSAERRRVAEHETVSRVTEARKAAMATMDAIARHQIGPLVAAVGASKKFYNSPADTLLRTTLGSERRARVVANLGSAGPMELWHAAVTALQGADADLAAAVIQTVRALPLDQQPFSGSEFAGRLAYPPHENAARAINSIDRDTQAAILLWRVVQQGKANPIGRVQNALHQPVIKEAMQDAVALSDSLSQ